MDFSQLPPLLPSPHDEPPTALYTAEQVQAAVEAAIATLPETP